MLWNLDGIRNVCELLEQYDRSFQILCLCETWHTAAPADHPFFSHNYKAVHSLAIRERSRGRASGGLIIYYSTKYTAHTLDVSPWWIACLFSYNSITFVLILIYFKPSLDIKNILEVFQITLAEIRECSSGIPIIICGDFNCRVGSLGPVTSEIVEQSCLQDCHTSLDQICNSRGSDLLEFMNTNSFLLVNGRTYSDSPARYTYCSVSGNSVIDLLWCSAGDLQVISDLRVLNSILCSSGHFPLEFCLSGSNQDQIERNNREQQSLTSRSVFAWDAAKALSYSSAMACAPEVSHLGNDIQGGFDNLTRVVKTVAADLGMLKVRSFPCHNFVASPWFDRELKSLKRSASLCLRECRRNNFSEPFLSEFLLSKREYKKVVKQKKNKYQRSVILKLSNVRNQGEFWKTLLSVADRCLRIFR